MYIFIQRNSYRFGRGEDMEMYRARYTLSFKTALCNILRSSRKCVISGGGNYYVNNKYLIYSIFEKYFSAKNALSKKPIMKHPRCRVRNESYPGAKHMLMQVIIDFF